MGIFNDISIQKQESEGGEPQSVTTKALIEKARIMAIKAYPRNGEACPKCGAFHSIKEAVNILGEDDSETCTIYCTACDHVFYDE